MYRERTVGVVLPAYNEEGFVGDVIREIPPYVDRIYAIDDRSTDDTWNEIHNAARDDAQKDSISKSPNAPKPVVDGGTHPLTDRASIHDRIGRVVPIQHHENRGAGGAIKTGYFAAREDNIDITVTVDADGQMDLSQMPRLLDPIVEDKADYAKGNRLLSEKYRAEMPRFRLIGNTILTFLTKVSSGYWKTMDPQNGYTAISHEALATIDLEELYEYYGYCNDLLVKLNVRGMRVADIAMPAVYGEEVSSINYTEYIPKVSLMLLSNFLWRVKTKYLVLDFNPLALFYGVGAVMLFGSCLNSGLLLVTLLTGIDVPVFQASTTTILFTCGTILLLFAMVFDMAESEHLETQIQ